MSRSTNTAPYRNTRITTWSVYAPFLGGTLAPGAFISEENGKHHIVGLITHTNPKTGALEASRVDRPISQAQAEALFTDTRLSPCEPPRHTPRSRPAARKRCDKGVDND